MEELMEKNTEEEVTEEEVQAVANAIVEEANETDATVEEVINTIIEEGKGEYEEVTNKGKKPKSNKKIDFEGRGFTSLKDAENFVNTEVFAKLGKEDQEEYLNWLNK